jgi:hypothetical protein
MKVRTREFVNAMTGTNLLWQHVSKSSATELIMTSHMFVRTMEIVLKKNVIVMQDTEETIVNTRSAKTKQTKIQVFVTIMESVSNQTFVYVMKFQRVNMDGQDNIAKMQTVQMDLSTRHSVQTF